MSKFLKEQLKNYISGYQKVNAITVEERKKKAKEDIFEALQSNFLFAIQNNKKSVGSGFVDMYKILAKSKK
jgi:hypothetical protein